MDNLEEKDSTCFNGLVFLCVGVVFLGSHEQVSFFQPLKKPFLTQNHLN